ncbi:MAG: hypothetical protein F6J86_26290 [Symploca sp. SIO1B1]|nr:hypothetical protein [Symploca sp. SIO1B1]
MSKTSFNVEDVKSLLHQINEFCETLEQEWNKVSNQWSNLKSTWHDEQFNKFEPIFEKMLFAYEEEITKCKSYTIFLAQQIQIAQQRNNKLVDLTVDVTKKTVDLSKKSVAWLDTTQKVEAFLEEQTKIAEQANKMIADLIKKSLDLAKKGVKWLDMGLTIGQTVISLFAVIPFASSPLSTEPISPVEQQMIIAEAKYKSLPLIGRSMPLDEQLEKDYENYQKNFQETFSKKQKKEEKMKKK